MTKKIVAIVDDDDAVRDSLGILLAAEGYRVRSFGTAADFIENVERDAVGCLLLDVNMPEIDGFALLRRVVVEWPELAVVMITGRAEVEIAVRAMKSGAVDFIAKPFDETVFLETVREAVERSLTAAARRSDNDEIAARIALLSGRERDVLNGLVAGLPNKTIAYDLQISPRTVEIYRGRLMEKMQAKSFSELIRLATAAGVAPPPKPAP
jgi:two-component system response regulator FixJ